MDLFHWLGSVVSLSGIGYLGGYFRSGLFLVFAFS